MTNFDSDSYDWKENVNYIDLKEIPGSEPDFVSLTDIIEIKGYRFICHSFEVDKRCSKLIKSGISIRTVCHSLENNKATCPLCARKVIEKIECEVGITNIFKLGNVVKAKRRFKLFKGLVTS